MVLFSRKLTKLRFTCPHSDKFEQLRIPKCEVKNLETALSEINWSEHLTGEQVEDNCNAFMTVIQTTMSGFMKNIKHKPRKKNHLPWLNSNIWSLMKQRDHALKIALL